MIRWLILLVCGWVIGVKAPAEPLFEVHASTRQVTCVGPGCIGTTGGLRSLNGAPPQLLGTAIRGVSGDYLATDRGLFRRTHCVDEQPASAVLHTGRGLFSGHAQGRIYNWQTGTNLHCPTSAPIHSLAYSDGALWAASSEGVWRLDRANPVGQKLTSNPVASTVTCLVAGQDGVIAGTPAGVFRCRGGDWVSMPSPLEVSALALGPAGEVYVGTASDGVHLDGRRLSGPAHVTALGWSADGLVVGTPDGAFLDGRPVYSVAGEIADNHVTALACSPDQVWAGTFLNGLSRYANGTWSRVPGLPSAWVNHVAYAQGDVWTRFSDGTLFKGATPVKLLKPWTSSLGDGWVGTYSGFSLLQRGKWQHFAPKPALQGTTVTAVALLGREVWLGSQSGLFCYDQGKCEQVLSPLSDSWITSFVSFDGRLWAGTFRGGLCVGSGHDWTAYGASSALGSDRVHCLITTSDGVWAGTPAGLVYTNGRRWKQFGVKQGLPSNTVWALAERKGELWIGTDSGLARASLKRLLEP